MLESISTRVQDLTKRLARKPGLGILLVGDHAPSTQFVKLKIKKCHQVGIEPLVIHLDSYGSQSMDTPFSEFIKEWPIFPSHNPLKSAPHSKVTDYINYLNHDSAIDGIILQLPVPNSIARSPLTKEIPALSPDTTDINDTSQFLDNSQIMDLTSLVDPCKDVDGLHFTNIGKCTILGNDRSCHSFSPCTPSAVMEIIRNTVSEYPDFSLEGKHIVVIGRSMLVGRPLANLLLHREELGGANCTITVCHSFSSNIKEICQQADILVSATGDSHLIQPDWIKENVFIIDVGFSVVEKEIISKSHNFNPSESKQKGTTTYTICGDVDPLCYEKSRFYTPVPGGVGPMTIAMLLTNTIEACSRTAERLNK